MNCSLSVTGLDLAEVSASVALVAAGSSWERQLAPRAETGGRGARGARESSAGFNIGYSYFSRELEIGYCHLCWQFQSIKLYFFYEKKKYIYIRFE